MKEQSFSQLSGVFWGLLRQSRSAGIMLLALLLAIGASAREVTTTNCKCGGFYTADGKLVTISQLLGAPLVNGHFSSAFGLRFHPILKRVAFHWGIDFRARRHSPVFAAASGTVEQARWAGAYGNYLRVRYGTDVALAYAHLDGFAAGIAAGIAAGTPVKRGTVLGYVGSTGRSTSWHLHLELYVHGRRVRPDCICFEPLPMTKPRHGKRTRLKS
jgi:murein DD-endopeptidase MepM/ murein hydrolase activator NlpD